MVYSPPSLSRLSQVGFLLSAIGIHSIVGFRNCLSEMDWTETPHIEWPEKAHFEWECFFCPIFVLRFFSLIHDPIVFSARTTLACGILRFVFTPADTFLFGSK